MQAACSAQNREQQYGEVIENVLPNGYRWPNATVPYLFDGVFGK